MSVHSVHTGATLTATYYRRVVLQLPIIGDRLVYQPFGGIVLCLRGSRWSGWVCVRDNAAKAIPDHAIKPNGKSCGRP